jgi:hypothetical protein
MKKHGGFIVLALFVVMIALFVGVASCGSCKVQYAVVSVEVIKESVVIPAGAFNQSIKTKIITDKSTFVIVGAPRIVHGSSVTILQSDDWGGRLYGQFEGDDFRYGLV